MNLMTLPVWSDSSGVDTGPIGRFWKTDADAQAEVAHWLRSGRPNIRVIVSDGVTFEKIGTYRPKPARPQLMKETV